MWLRSIPVTAAADDCSLIRCCPPSSPGRQPTQTLAIRASREAHPYAGRAMTRRPLPFHPTPEARGQWEAHGWPDAAPGMAAVTSLMRAQQIVLARVEEV